MTINWVNTLEINRDVIVFKTRVADGRFFRISPEREETSNEYIIVLSTEGVYSQKVPLLLRNNIREFQLFSIQENKYYKTELPPIIRNQIRQLIGSTILNRYNILFGEFTLE